MVAESNGDVETLLHNAHFFPILLSVVFVEPFNPFKTMTIFCPTNTLWEPTRELTQHPKLAKASYDLVVNEPQVSWH
jgi:hypothetical protein